MSVVIETTIGDITVDLFMEERPVASLNFIKLCKLKYYNFNLFHNVEQGFIAQTGDPTGAGDGGSSVWGVVEGPHKRFFEAESLPKIRHTTPGLLSLVSVGKNMVGSQFFFTLGSDLTSLDGIHCVIGEVVEGHEILRKLNEAIVDEKFRPYQDVRITHTVVLDDPYPDPRGFRVASRSPSPCVERMQNGRIGADEDIDDTGGKTIGEIQELLADREAKARATILEIVGDLPDADMAPPENVLFVCKLNPVTTDDDLEIIFSRFGKVKGCEVIRDKKTGDSLQYAFVEFEEQKSCEAAYFKMDNVLIDDRRIHVDFSQSVAKVKWRGKGRGVEGHEGRLDFNNLKETNKNIRKERKSDNVVTIRQEKERSRMTSEERIQARLERRRKREEEYPRRIIRSRSRSRSRLNQRYFDSRVHSEVRAHERERHREDIYDKRPVSRNYHSRNRSNSGERDRKRVMDKRYSTGKQRYDKHSPNRSHRVESSKDRTREFPEDSKPYKAISEKRKNDDLKNKPRKKKKRNTKSKKKAQSSSDDSSSSSSDSNSTSSESTSDDTSTDSSSSKDKRKKKKKRKSKKHGNSKKSKKCKDKSK